jgi:hypothetical protein
LVTVIPFARYPPATDAAATPDPTAASGRSAAPAVAATAPTATESKAMVAADLRIEYLDFLVSSSAKAYTKHQLGIHSIRGLRSIHL